MSIPNTSFLVVEPIRNLPAVGATHQDRADLGLPNANTQTGGVLMESVEGAMFRNTNSAELLKIVGTDDYENFEDRRVYSEDEDSINEYWQFVDYLKLYILNTGNSLQSGPRFASTTLTRITKLDDVPVTTTDLPNINKGYYALGLVDGTDYAEIDIDTASTTNDYDADRDLYSDGTIYGFPRTDISASQVQEKTWRNIARVGYNEIWSGSAVIDDAGVGSLKPAPKGLHKVIRKIQEDKDLYYYQKYIRPVWSGDMTDGVDVYVFGETNSSLVIGKVTCEGDFDSISPAPVALGLDGTTVVRFTYVYGILVTEKDALAAEDVCWNAFNADTLTAPGLDISIQYTTYQDGVGESTDQKEWVKLTADENAFSLTFFDETLISYANGKAFFVSPTPNRSIFSSVYFYDPDDVEEDRHPNLVYADVSTSFVINATDTLATITLLESAPASDPAGFGTLAAVSVGDRVLFEDSDSVQKDLGYVVSQTGTQIITSVFDPSIADDVPITGGTLTVVGGQSSRIGIWMRREVACQSDESEAPNVDLEFEFVFYPVNTL